MDKTVSGNFNLNSMPKSMLLYRHYYQGNPIPTVSNYFRYAGAFSDYVKSIPYAQTKRFFIKGMKGPNLLTAEEGKIPL
ncbi:hypothetical protein [Nodosilinea nodulosa]|uniref:hypothetical protein n=1 Tax=Nodosilinea nodulosa TaxID=416001 RepID=UPI0003612BA7|nr:hypothetical protein [Nodosilinea nodulosa]